MGSEHWDDNGCCTRCGRLGNTHQACPYCYGLGSQLQLQKQTSFAGSLKAMYPQGAISSPARRPRCEACDAEKFIAADRDEYECRTCKLKAAIDMLKGENEALRKDRDSLREKHADDHKDCLRREQVAYKRANEAGERAMKLGDECGILRDKLKDADHLNVELRRELDRFRRRR